jgi:hypothetical protein
MQISLILFGLSFVFHLSVITGIVFFNYVPLDALWGGRMETKEQLLVFEIISSVFLVLCILIVMIRSGMIRLPGLITASRIAFWILFALFLLNTAGNIFAETLFEKFFAILTAVLALLCLRLAMEKPDQSIPGEPL